jgi:hypothetical protein
MAVFGSYGVAQILLAAYTVTAVFRPTVDYVAYYAHRAIILHQRNIVATGAVICAHSGHHVQRSIATSIHPVIAEYQWLMAVLLRS